MTGAQVTSDKQVHFENWISYRYLIASKGRFLTFLNVISILGVAIGVAALIVVTGVMTGFGNNLREKIIGTTPHIMVEKEVGVKDFQAVKEKLVKIEGVKGASAYVQGNIFLENSGQAVGLILRGIEPASENQVTKIDQYLVKGDLKSLTGDTAIIGSELARYFGLTVGDEVTFISPGSGLTKDKWRYKVKVVGVFNSGMVDLDMNLVLTNLKKAQEIFGLAPDVSSGIGVKLQNPEAAKEIKDKVYNLLGFSFIVKTWIDINRNLFEALFLEKWGLFIVLMLMVLVASFNIVSTLVVTVSSKVHDIGILKSVGASSQSIKRIFTNQGILIGAVGTLWGLLGGFGLSYILRHYIEVPKEIYSIDHVPVEIQLSDVLIIVFVAMTISFLASIYPAARASRLQPVEALRYE